MKNIANIITKALLLICMMVSTTIVWAEGEEPGGDPTPTGITTADQLKTALTAANSSDPITATLTDWVTVKADQPIWF